MLRTKFRYLANYAAIIPYDTPAPYRVIHVLVSLGCGAMGATKL